MILKHIHQVAIFIIFRSYLQQVQCGRHFHYFMRGETKHLMLLELLSLPARSACTRTKSISAEMEKNVARVARARSRQKHLAPITGVKHTPINYKNENGGAQEIPGVLREKA